VTRREEGPGQPIGPRKRSFLNKPWSREQWHPSCVRTGENLCHQSSNLFSFQRAADPRQEGGGTGSPKGAGENGPDWR